MTERKLLRAIDKKAEEVRSTFDIPGLIGIPDPSSKTKKEPMYEDFADFCRKVQMNINKNDKFAIDCNT